MPNGAVYEVGINETVKVKGGWMSRSYLLFAGMPDERTYSLVMTFTNVHNSIAYNLFMPKSQTEVKLIKGRLIVQRVTPTSLTFRFEGAESAMGRAPL